MWNDLLAILCFLIDVFVGENEQKGVPTEALKFSGSENFVTPFREMKREMDWKALLCLKGVKISKRLFMRVFTKHMFTFDVR